MVVLVLVLVVRVLVEMYCHDENSLYIHAQTQQTCLQKLSAKLPVRSHKVQLPSLSMSSLQLILADTQEILPLIKS